jgi:hypothetical protein
MSTGILQDLLAREDANFSQYVKDSIKYSKYKLNDTKQNKVLFQKQYLKDHEQEVYLFATKLYITIREENPAVFKNTNYKEQLLELCVSHAQKQIIEDAAHFHKQLIAPNAISQMQYIEHLRLTKGEKEVAAFQQKEKIIKQKIEKIKDIKEVPSALQILSDLQNWIKCWLQKLTKNSLDDIKDYNHSNFKDHCDVISLPYKFIGEDNVSVSSGD